MDWYQLNVWREKVAGMSPSHEREIEMRGLLIEAEIDQSTVKDDAEALRRVWKEVQDRYKKNPVPEK